MVVILDLKEFVMSTIHCSATTTSTPAQSSPDSPTSDPAAQNSLQAVPMPTSRCMSSAPDTAAVTEGSAGIWERLHYGWSVPNLVTLMTTDSKVFGGGSGYT
jgi:hypothetical protein